MIVHVYQERVEVDPETERRNTVAKATWKSQGWVERWFNDNHFVRHAGNTIKGEKKDFPYIRDILRLGCLGLRDTDILVFTNADTCVAHNFTEKALELLETYPALHCHRRDFGRLEEPINDNLIPTGAHYPGSDAFVFTAGWWRKHHSDFPDLVMGVEVWDKIMRQLVVKTAGGELKDAIYHEWHPSFWEQNRLTNPSNIYCRNLAREWLKKNNLPLEELNFTESYDYQTDPHSRNSLRGLGGGQKPHSNGPKRRNHLT